MEMTEAQLLTIVKNVVEEHGCKLVEVDFENQIINVEGSEEDKGRCARALAEILG